MFQTLTIREKNAKSITLLDGTKTDTWSKDYMVYCEALNLSKKTLQERRYWLNKLQDKSRVENLKKWLTLIWQKN
jgi:hypothetical protein|tara:strand:+ start:21 stop:245 length:225 start_codon:yes stop_codon:yes gene_type:complete